MALICSTCQNPCNNYDACVTPTCFNCTLIPCVACVDTISSDCVFLTNDIKCNTELISKGVNLESVIQQLLCKIDRLEFQVDYIKRSFLPASTYCEIPIIINTSTS